MKQSRNIHGQNLRLTWFPKVFTVELLGSVERLGNAGNEKSDQRLDQFF
jgi:hypothetical protein